MAAPQFVPVDPVAQPRSYAGPAHVPDSWTAGRPASFTGRQPTGPRLGVPGPDQGYALLLAARLHSRVIVSDGESVDDALSGCLGIALRRASLYGRAPVIHDLTIALTIWGYLDPTPPPELVKARAHAFEGLHHIAHHYAEARALVDQTPEETLRMKPEQVATAYPAQWRDLVGTS